MDSTSLSSIHNKRINFAQRSIPSKLNTLQHRNFSIDSNSNSLSNSGSNRLLENVSLEQEHLDVDNETGVDEEMNRRDNEEAHNTTVKQATACSSSSSTPKHNANEKAISDKLNNINELPKNNDNLVNSSNTKIETKLNNSQNEPKTNININMIHSSPSASATSSNATPSPLNTSNAKPSLDNSCKNEDLVKKYGSPGCSNTAKESKTVTKSNILRNLFFFQNEDGQSNSKT